ncbi:MalY/PatB family protein [Planococcus maritimus]|uniref:MalY/PatB family protein n=1 Tax=Planococcus maritimus TaxID=192421 RepID=UPI00079B4591|nr:MalY/PatB family protein [Planococcus maritimus]KYG59353.1 aminotransferase [Planococcus maritimus]OED33059.1 aminotransferase [Planococcus maritimus]
MNYNFDEAVERRGTYSLKWDGAELIKQFGITDRYDEETIPLFTADMDLPVAQPIVDALHKTVDHRIFGYTILPDAYFEAIQHYFHKRYDWAIKKEEIVFSPGTVHALNIAVKAFTEPGDGVIIQRPVYPPFTSAVEGNGRVVKNNALVQDEAGRYSINFEEFEELAKDENTHLFIHCHPHNPTGRVFTPEESNQLAAICKRHNVTIITDEIHGDLVRRGETFTPMVLAAEETDHIVTCTAINKTFNVAGLHCTNVIIENEALREKFTAELGMQLPTPFTVAALIAAYTEGDDWLEQVNAYLDGTLEWMKNFLEERMPKVKVRIPEGTYVMWLDFRGYGLDDKEVHERIYNKANVILEDGTMFGEEGAGFQRICIPSPRPLIQEAMERIAREFDDLN